MSEQKKFYVTTPIYYVNARPHIGHAYTTIVADVLARRHRLLGEETFFLTGTDEHGQKIERSAAAAGVPPQQFADEVSAQFETLWKRMGITNDAYIRTTDPKHAQGVQKLFSKLYDNGKIYLDSYTGAYCVSDEAFVDVEAGVPCPDCGRITETVTEENFFFKLSEFQLPLLNLIEGGDLRIENEARRNEVLSFLRGNVNAARPPAVSDSDTAFTIAEDAVNADGAAFPGVPAPIEAGAEESPLPHLAYTERGHPYVPGALKDLSVSRSSFTWGIPVPEPAASAAKQKHVIYVWLDALANYMTAVGYGGDETEFSKWWPADLHLVGKEIIRFHCVYWPAFLLAADLPLPKAITAHGWLLFDNSKMSKSKGNIVRTETILEGFGEHVYGKQFPESTKEERDLFASDILRYFLLREIPFGQDGSFSFEAMIDRYNADLANGFGNLVSRTLKMIQQNCGGNIPTSPFSGLGDSVQPFELSDGVPRYTTLASNSVIASVQQRLEAREFGSYLKKLAEIISDVDGFLSETAPWKLAKSSEAADAEDLSTILSICVANIYVITALLHPILPIATAAAWRQLGLGDIELAARNGELSNLKWGGLKPGTKLGPLTPIFPRADKGLAQIMSDMENPTPASSNPSLKEAMTPAPVEPIAAASFDPAAPPRSGSLDEPTGTLPVAGSAAISTERESLSHTDALSSGIFAAEAAKMPVPNPAAGAATPGDASTQITIDDFAKVELRVAQIKVAERIPKADKLLRLEVDLGPDFPQRQILSGIAEWYTPEDLIGRRIVVITNLAPRKMRGLESHGMLLAASNGENGKPVLATFGEDIALGSRLK